MSMKISKVMLKNFRWYKEEMPFVVKDMNIILWKNDVWKSTILEALDIFFNEKNACSPISMDDINISWRSEWNMAVEIGVCFNDFDDSIILETIPTSLSWEYLLNADGELQIKKRYEWSTMKSTTYIIANHPSNDDTLKELLLKKISDLQKIIKEKSIISVDGKSSVSSVLRKAIRESYWTLLYNISEIPADKEGAKELREKIQLRLPVYTLFQADRSNTDQDDEIQNPMAIALKTILSEPTIASKLAAVFDEVRKKITDVATGTLWELQKINPNLAQQLSPKFPEADKLTRSKAFPKTEINSDNVPLNKRGSWVKRMVLLAFFLNEVERRKREEWLSDVIYAFEEPETSQHPQHQKILIDSFLKLSKETWVQIILTTHSPYVYKDCIDWDTNLIYIEECLVKWRKVNDVFSSLNLFSHSPTRWEINYYIYGLPTIEFFDELYSGLEELKQNWQHVDDLILANSVLLKDQQWKRADSSWNQEMRNGTPVIDQTTYITCIRHQIHHSNNKLNTNYIVRLENWIRDMILILWKLT